MSKSEYTIPALPVRDYDDLIKVPPGVKVRIWGTTGRDAKIIDKAFGLILVAGEDGLYHAHSPSRDPLLIGKVVPNTETTADTIQLIRDNFRAAADTVKQHWDETIPMLGKRMIVIHSHVYVDGGHMDPVGDPGTLGSGGKLWFLKAKATGKILLTNNLWPQGRIPKEYRKRDTHIELPKIPEGATFDTSPFGAPHAE